MRVCGIRGGEPFATVTRSDLQNKCPSGYSPCSKNTKAQNTICYETARGDASCPITGIQFVDAVDDPSTAAWIANKKTKDSETWHKVAFDSDQTIMYTKDTD